MTRQITDAALKLIERNEGLRLDAYRDPVGIETIGYGHTRGVRPGQHVTQAQAEDLLRQDVESAAGSVERGIGAAPTTDSQFGAMVSLCFNVGGLAFRNSTVLRKHVAGDHKAAADAFLMWSKAHVNGELVMLPGLLRRRQEERLMYLAADAQPRPVAPAVPLTHQATAVAAPQPSFFDRVRRALGF